MDGRIASTMQQMSISFGVATAGLATVFFIPGGAHSNALQMIHGVHESLVTLGVFTIISSSIFHGLRPGDGQNVSRHKTVPAE